MPRELVIISCVENKERFVWETETQLFNLFKYGLTDKFRLLIFLPAYQREFLKEWKELETRYPEAKFFYYTDVQNKVTDLMVNYDYVPIHRLCSLEKHFKDHPELQKSAVFYLDSDVIFTSEPPIASYVDDDINYLSDTKTYLNEVYLSGKIKDVIPEKKEQYEKLGVIDKAAKFAGLTIEDLRSKNNNTGGAQYLLKDISPKFFSECIDLCLQIRIFFQTINQEFFPGNTRIERENSGIQSYCADMWAIQWNLWRHGLPSSTDKWMNFAWATDKIEALTDKWMLHNAGITSDASIRITLDNKTIKGEDGKSTIVDVPSLWKGKYYNKSIFDDIESIKIIVNNKDSQKYCTSRYAQEVLETYNNLIKTK